MLLKLIKIFVGRATELQKIKDILLPEGDDLDRRVLILGGLGGIGKTQLVIAYIKRHGSLYDFVFWLNSYSEATLKGSLRSLAMRTRILDVQNTQLDDDQIRVRILNWLSETNNRQWLLVFDNHDDLEEYDIKQYYAFASQGSIIITTRSPDLLSGKPIHVEKLRNLKDSLCILAIRSGRVDVDSDLQARDLATEMDGLPLALATAGAYLRQYTISFADYLQSYQTKWNILQNMARELPEYRDRTLYTIWDLSFTQVRRQDPCAANLLMILAYFDNEEVWYELLAAGKEPCRPSWFDNLISDRLIFDSAMRTLVDFSLVEVHAIKGSYSLHTCVHDWILDALNRPVDPSSYKLAFDCVVKMVNIVDLDSIATVQDRRRLAAHAKMLGHERFNDVPADELWTTRYSEIELVASLLKTQNKFEPAEKFLVQVLTGYEKSLEPDHPDTLRVVQNLGSLYQGRGKMDDAERMWARALAGYEKALEPDHPDMLLVVQNLGMLYHGRGKMDEAERIWTRALAGYENALGPYHISILDMASNLGCIF